jgi:putative membrane protein
VILAAGAAGDLWQFRPHPEVWVLILGLAFLWWYAVNKIGPKATLPGEPIMTRSQFWWGLGALLTLWLASDWPIHDIGENYLYSVHMTQHVLFQFAVAPMVLLACPTWLARMLLGGGRGYRVTRALTRIVPATLLFNAVVILSHWPFVVNHAVESSVLHYGVHVLVVGTALLMWMPVCGPIPEFRFSLPVQGCHLLLQTVLPTVPAGWLTMAESTVYRTYDRTDKIWGMDTIYDQQIAGAIMKLGEAAVLWVLIGIIFIRWATKAQADDRQRGMELDRRAPDSARVGWTD